MKILISPAKTQNFVTPHLSIHPTVPTFLDSAKMINNQLKQFSLAEIKELMKTSDTLATTTFENIKNWGTAQNGGGMALFSYSGEVFKSMNVATFTANDVERTNASLRILSGLYGILKPTDQIMPYRIEVKTTIQIAGHKNLYQFWKEKVTNFLLAELKKDELIIDLASAEYSKMINFKQIPHDVIKPIFKVDVDGVLKNQAVWAKKARGLFSRYLLTKDITSFDEMFAFSAGGFSFHSFDEEKGELLYIRKK